MRRIQRLNIGNTQLSANLNFYDINDYVMVKSLDDLNTKYRTRKFLLDYDALGYDDILKALDMMETDNFSISTTKPLPLQVMLQVGNNPHTCIVYKLTKVISDDILEDIQRYSQIVSTGVYIDVSNTDLGITDILFSLNDAEIILDRVYLYFSVPSQTAKLKYYSYLHNILAGWKMQLHINATPLEQAELLTEYESWC